jgi:hypothetical protein
MVSSSPSQADDVENDGESGSGWYEFTPEAVGHACVPGIRLGDGLFEHACAYPSNTITLPTKTKKNSTLLCN